MKKKLVNLTSRIIVLWTPQGRVEYPSLRRADVVTNREVICDSPRLIRNRYKWVVGLPEPEDGTYYIVSRVVGKALPYRLDLVTPTMFERDGDGNIVACRAFELINDAVFDD